MVISIRLPEQISEYLVDDLDICMNTIFPKMFFNIEIEKGRLKFNIPSKVDIDTIIHIVSDLSYNRGEDRRIQITLPRITRSYVVHYDTRKCSIKYMESTYFGPMGEQYIRIQGARSMVDIDRGIS